MERYELDYLKNEFEKHAIQAKKDLEKMREQFLKMSPGQELPEHLKEDFSLPKALFTLVKEIEELKNA